MNLSEQTYKIFRKDEILSPMHWIPPPRKSSLQAKYNKERGFDGYTFSSKIHAEMMVINKIRYLDIDFNKVRIFVWRGNKSPQLSKPCAACEKAHRDLGIKKIIYTGNYKVYFRLYNNSLIIIYSGGDIKLLECVAIHRYSFCTYVYGRNHFAN